LTQVKDRYDSAWQKGNSIVNMIFIVTKIRSPYENPIPKPNLFAGGTPFDRYLTVISG
jgi:hypothetical protein